ncbi:right-handed parallel beta-helix repeat-containing protein [Rubellicoccus peritrichatus]|uniref:Right-handed parallel beta-helix repeat-containing protein n=1 Tax=Rubellicoccus peritrichatus TaxID=3080537 RepID=A0AAQ3QVZ7_9BACT|nr:right-handed parallel beta-helix repeat-containing protein [Puniceicoccus sp. CR14]WOO41415.1 right-handed parallel beta-helix repeat-containing protein [Puniceicoccus sp. CR14]
MRKGILVLAAILLLFVLGFREIVSSPSSADVALFWDSKVTPLIAEYEDQCGVDESWVPRGNSSCLNSIGVGNPASLRDALRSAGPGTCITIEKGIYDPVRISLSGTAEHPIIIRGSDAVRVIFEGSARDNISITDSKYLILENVSSRGAKRAGISILDSSHIIVRDCVVEDNGYWGIFTGFVSQLLLSGNSSSGSLREHGIYVSNSGDHVTIRNNHVFDNARSGIQLNADASMGGDGIISDTLIEQNTIENNGSDGGAALNLDGVSNSIIRGNIMLGNHGGGIALFRIDGATGSTRNIIYDNRIEQSADGRWCININSGSFGNILFRNYLVTDHDFRGSIVIDDSSRKNFHSFRNLAQGPFSLDGEQNRISLTEWQRAGYGQETKAPAALTGH